MNFGESLLEPDQLLFQLHNSNVCSDALNGFALMRMDALMADEAAKFETTTPPQACYCSSEDEYSSEEENDSSSDGTSSSDEENQNFRLSSGELWSKEQRKTGDVKHGRGGGGHNPMSSTSLERPLVGGEEEDGALSGAHENLLPDNISIASLLDGLLLEPAPSKVLPPPPPPRKLATNSSVARISTGSVPIITDTVDTSSNQRRGSTSSLQFNHGPSKTSDDSTLSGEDFTAKFVGGFWFFAI